MINECWTWVAVGAKKLITSIYQETRQFFRFQVFNVFLFILSFQNLITRFFFPFSFVGFFVARAKPSAKLVCKTVTNRKRSFCLLHLNKKFNLILLKHALHACKKKSFKNKNFFLLHTYFESDFIILCFSLQYITRPAWAGFKTAEEGRTKIM